MLLNNIPIRTNYKACRSCRGSWSGPATGAVRHGDHPVDACGRRRAQLPGLGPKRVDLDRHPTSSCVYSSVDNSPVTQMVRILPSHDSTTTTPTIYILRITEPPCRDPYDLFEPGTYPLRLTDTLPPPERTSSHSWIVNLLPLRRQQTPSPSSTAPPFFRPARSLIQHILCMPRLVFGSNTCATR